MEQQLGLSRLQINHFDTTKLRWPPLGEARPKLADFLSLLLVLYEQQAGDANLFPGSTAQECGELLGRSWKCGCRFPEQGVGPRWAVLRCGLSNQIVKPLGLLVSECDCVIAGTPRQNESRSSSYRFTDWLPTKPYEPSFYLWVIFNNSVIEETTYPGGGDLRLWHGMVEPLADVECESAPFKVIEHRPS